MLIKKRVCSSKSSWDGLMYQALWVWSWVGLIHRLTWGSKLILKLNISDFSPVTGIWCFTAHLKQVLGFVWEIFIRIQLHQFHPNACGRVTWSHSDDMSRWSSAQKKCVQSLAWSNSFFRNNLKMETASKDFKKSFLNKMFEHMVEKKALRFLHFILKNIIVHTVQVWSSQCWFSDMSLLSGYSHDE